jgi:hypothetical protein
MWCSKLTNTCNVSAGITVISLWIFSLRPSVVPGLFICTFLFSRPHRKEFGVLASLECCIQLRMDSGSSHFQPYVTEYHFIRVEVCAYNIWLPSVHKWWFYCWRSGAVARGSSLWTENNIQGGCHLLKYCFLFSFTYEQVLFIRANFILFSFSGMENFFYKGRFYLIQVLF